MLLTVVSGERGTRVYLNGMRVNDNPRLRMFYPHRPGCKTRLILGNDVHGNSSWHGTIFDLALYDVALSDSQVTADYRRWAVGGDINAAGTPMPKIWYRFDRPLTDGRVPNLAADVYPLNVPADMIILKKAFIAWPHSGRWWSMVQDMTINLLGFIPLGFMLCAIFSRCNGFARRRYWWLAVGLAFAFSLSLEIAQAWIPSRDSSMSDLVMNTLGAGLGCEVFRQYG